VRIDYWMHHDLTGDFRVAMEHPLLIDMSVHHLDLLRFVTGLEAREVLASSWNPPWSQFAGDASAACLFTMTNGARVLYNGSWHARAQHDDWNCTWLVECERGYLRLGRGRVRLYEGEPGEPDDVQEEVEVPLVPLVDLNQAGVLAEFTQAVRSGGRTSITAADNLRSIGLVFAALRSVREGRAVPVAGAGAATPR
jgi:predicted dehydrogenase